MYEIEGRNSSEFKRRLKREAGEEQAVVEEALDAICANPGDPNSKPDPDEKPAKRGTDLYDHEEVDPESATLRIYLPVYRLRIKKTGFRIQYEVNVLTERIRIKEMKRNRWLFLEYSRGI